MKMVIKYTTKTNIKTLSDGRRVAKDKSKIKTKELDELEVEGFIYDNEYLLINKTPKDKYDRRQAKMVKMKADFLEYEKKVMINKLPGTLATTLEIDGNVYPLDRVSIQKYTEATTITE